MVDSGPSPPMSPAVAMPHPFARGSLLFPHSGPRLRCPEEASMRTGCSRLHFVLLLALLVPGCASNRSVVSFDLRRWHGPPGRSLVIERGELRVEGRNGPVLTLWARSPEDPRCAAGTVEATGAFRESAASFGSIRLCPTDDGREGWFRWHAEVDSPPGVASARGLPPAFDFAVEL